MIICVNAIMMWLKVIGTKALHLCTRNKLIESNLLILPVPVVLAVHTKVVSSALPVQEMYSKLRIYAYANLIMHSAG